MDAVFLSICIPTFNRAAYLDICLRSFCLELKHTVAVVEIIVSDNCSDDNTQEIAVYYISQGYPVRYIKNDKNIGADANMVKCLEICCGEYFWIFGDDDLLLPGKLAIILNTLQRHRPSATYLGNYWFENDYEKERPVNAKPEKAIEYYNKKAFLKKVNMWTTFISAGIFKREVLAQIDISAFIGSNLNQLQWVLPSIFTNQTCLYMQGYYLACKGGNTGGYSLFQTFGKNLNDIITALKEKKLVPGYTADVINYYIIKDFMPIYCIRYKQGKLTGFTNEESPFIQLKKLYRKYFIYWLILFPLDILPVFLGKKYYFGLKKLKII